MSSPIVESEIRARLTDIFFKAAGGISDMAKDEVEQVMKLLKIEYKNGFSHGQDSLLRSGQSVPALFTEEEVKQLLEEQKEKWEKEAVCNALLDAHGRIFTLMPEPKKGKNYHFGFQDARNHAAALVSRQIHDLDHHSPKKAVA